jgi:phage-related protein
VRDWLKNDVSLKERKLIGADIMSAEFGWPIGMPTCRPLGDGLHEIRTDLANKISRVAFYVDRRQRMALLHGFIKKSQGMPLEDMRLARKRNAKHEKGLK